MVRVRVPFCCSGSLRSNIRYFQVSNEFKFPIAAFHHASEAYLVPDVIKRAYGETIFRAKWRCILTCRNFEGKPPAVALFATNGRCALSLLDILIMSEIYDDRQVQEGSIQGFGVCAENSRGERAYSSHEGKCVEVRRGDVY